jgi:hypothetical protein
LLAYDSRAVTFKTLRAVHVPPRAVARRIGAEWRGSIGEPEIGV